MFLVHFPISGVETWPFLPPVVSFVLAYFGAMAGVTGAFLLLPFQMSVLGYTAPGVSGTNFLYNVLAIPGTVFRYAREGRMNWPLALVIAGGTVPGIAMGYWVRVRFLADPRLFKPFAALVLLYLAFRLGKGLLAGPGGGTAPPHRSARIVHRRLSLRRFTFEFDSSTYHYNPLLLWSVSLMMGVVGGAYGIGGGAVLAPFCVSVLGLPVHAIAGATLFSTFVGSVAGVASYASGWGARGAATTTPDWLLGALFGMGGMLGGYLGARSQGVVPERPIKVGLLLVLIFVSIKYAAEGMGGLLRR